jgi:quercetin dioxygenase-like cupin family protein
MAPQGGIVVMKRLLPIAILALLAAPGSLANSPPVKSTTLVDTTRTVLGQPLVLPDKNPELKVTVLEIAPGAKLPRHEHPWSRYAYVLAGDLQVTFDQGLVKQYHTGDFIVEGVKAWHYGENIGSAPVRLLVIDQTEAGQPATVLAP